MKELLEYLIKALVEKPENVLITEAVEDTTTTYTIKVDSNELGRIIGKQGKTITALRTIFKAAGLKSGKNIRLELVDERPRPAKTETTEATDTTEIQEQQVQNVVNDDDSIFEPEKPVEQ